MTIPALTGVSALASRYEGFILDLWGTVHDGATAYPGAAEALLRLKAAGRRTVLLTNAPRRAQVLADQLAGMGIRRDMYDGIVSSGEAVHEELLRRSDPFFAALGRKLYHIGRFTDDSAFAGLDYRRVADPAAADFVLVTGPLSFEDSLEQYEEVLSACHAQALPMVCANPDIVAIREGRVVICAGSMAERYRAMGGRVVERGKPDPAIYAFCMENLGLVGRHRVCAIGDGLHTDIAGANAAGIDAYLIPGAVHGEDLGIGFGELPEGKRLRDLCRHHGGTPAGLLPALRW